LPILQRSSSRRANSLRSAARPGPGRPTAARVEEINRAIFEAARGEFINSGYESTRIETIAAAAGVSKGTLYDRYATKEALLRAVIAEQFAEWSAEWRPETGAMPSDLRERLRVRARRTMEYNCSGKLAVLERLFAGCPDQGEMRRMRHEVAHLRSIEVLAQDIIDGSAPTPVSWQSAIGIAEMLIGMLYIWWRARQDVESVRLDEALAFADHAVDVLMDGRATWGGAATGGSASSERRAAQESSQESGA
jgi:AcrR family transcriptional regulator